MTDEQLTILGRAIEIEIGDEREFLLVVIGPDAKYGTRFDVATNANKPNALNICKWVGTVLNQTVQDRHDEPEP
jgi:hypothetical protein